MRFSDLDGKTVGVWGAGRETRSFARHLSRNLPGAHLRVVVVEDRADEITDLGGTDFVVAGPDQAVSELSRCDVLVRSPGVSIHKPQLRELISRGLPTTTATGLWLAERGGRHVIAVTGTKGKSTTATLVAHLSAQLRSTHLAGNIGRPALDLIEVPSEDWVVLELSSYQIADLKVGPEALVITNLYREHIDWHGTESVYRAEKLRVASLPEVRSCAYRPGDPEIEAAVSRIPTRVRFGVETGWHLTSDGIRNGADTVIPTRALPLRGAHNAENLCAALAGLEAAGLALPPLPAGLEGVDALPHRLQTVHESDGIEWVDDSISTTPESSLAAIAAFPDRRIVLIAGGQDRGQDYAALGATLAQRDAALVTLPDTGARLARASLSAGLPVESSFQANDMAEAVHAARRFAEAGCVVLLSPAAPSYGSYRNFEERGDHFRALAAAVAPDRAGPTSTR